jgi:hypothetical protein
MDSWAGSVIERLAFGVAPLSIVEAIVDACICGVFNKDL